MSCRRGALLLMLSACLLWPSAGQAMTYSFDWHRGAPAPGLAIYDGAGRIESLSISLDDTTDLLSWSSTFTANPAGTIPDGGWLVLTDGTDPTGIDSIYAIFYADGVTGNLTSYVYDGAGSASSWQTSPFLQSDPGAVGIVEGPAGVWTFAFQLDVTAILGASVGPGWKGPAFTDHVGIWFHPTTGTQAGYAPDGSLTSWQIQQDGWFDAELPMPTVPTPNVPEPGAGLLLLLAAAAGLGLRRRASA